MKKLTQYTLLLLASLSFTSCEDKDKEAKAEEEIPAKDTKEAVVDDIINAMEEMAAAMTDGDKEKTKQLEAKIKEIEKRGEALGLTKDNSEDAFTEDQKKRLKEAVTKMMEASFKQMSDKLNDSK